MVAGNYSFCLLRPPRTPVSGGRKHSHCIIHRRSPACSSILLLLLPTSKAASAVLLSLPLGSRPQTSAQKKMDLPPTSLQIPESDKEDWESFFCRPRLSIPGRVTDRQTSKRIRIIMPFPLHTEPHFAKEKTFDSIFCFLRNFESNLKQCFL